MKILLLSDEESPYLWDYYRPGRLDGIDLILSCGDLKAEYLEFLVTMGRAPVLYVPGNHDDYARRAPEGCDCIDGKLVTVGGLRILGMGGSALYSGGPNQYTEAQMRRRLRKMDWRLRRAGGLDLLLTHAPPHGYGDAEDYAHRGFDCFLPFLDRWQPKYLIHGHVHLNYGCHIPRTHQYGQTTVLNAWERYILEL